MLACVLLMVIVLRLLMFLVVVELCCLGCAVGDGCVMIWFGPGFRWWVRTVSHLPLVLCDELVYF